MRSRVGTGPTVTTDDRLVTALWGFTGPPDAALAQRMSTALNHRGHHAPLGGPPVWTSSTSTVGIGLPRADPVLGGLAVSVRGDTCVAVAGRLPPNSSVDQWLNTFEQSGPTSLERAAGEWIAVAATPGRLTLLRDPAGARTVYWARHTDRILFAVEPKGIHRVPGFARRLSAVALAQYLTFSFVPGERTMLDGLFELQAGHRLDVDLSDGTTTVTRWFIHEATAPDDPDVPAETWIERTRDAVDAAVRERLPTHAPVVAFLSGGLDSSVVTTVAARQQRAAGRPAPVTLSLHFGREHPNELEFARHVATAARTDHHEIQIQADDLHGLLVPMVWHLDEPIGDPVTVGNFVLAGFAAGHGAWVLNGEGGDPVFGGPKNLPTLLSHWYVTGAGLAERTPNYLATWRRAGEEVNRLLHPDLRAQVDLERDVAGVLTPYLHAATPPHFLNKLMVTNMRLKGANLILPKVDRMLGAHGLTPLSPLFDPALIRLSMTMPPDLKLRAGIEKFVLKQAYAAELPPSIVARPKSGMRIPVHSWFQREPSAPRTTCSQHAPSTGPGSSTRNESATSAATAPDATGFASGCWSPSNSGDAT